MVVRFLHDIFKQTIVQIIVWRSTICKFKTGSMSITNFKIAISPFILDDLRERLGRARWPDEIAARRLLTDTLAMIGGGTDDGSGWPWPEERLSYSNASVAEALIVAGDALADGPALSRGLSLLEFLLRTQTRDGHLSVTPVGGRGRDDAGPGYDQQPIEVSALADACGSAFRITGEPSWLAGIDLAWDWFLGANDSATPMFNPQTGGGYDGLERHGRNLNQGAESTLAMLATAQQARRISEPE